jgi:hypothetical protein
VPNPGVVLLRQQKLGPRQRFFFFFSFGEFGYGQKHK